MPKNKLKIALYQPDIPQNVGAIIRLCACMDAGLDIIAPCGFPWDIKKIKQSAIDYYNAIIPQHHLSTEKFFDFYQGKQRIILMSTKGDCAYSDFIFQKDDILLAGRESAGVPDEVFKKVNASVFIPMKTGLRSINIVNATSMILGEALRQTQWNSK